MITALAIALQLAVAPPAVLSVRVGERTSVVPVVQTSAGPAVAPERMAPLVQTQLRGDVAGRFLLTI